MALAAERLFGTHPNATAYLMASIAQDPMAQESLNAQLRTLTTLKTFDALNHVVLMLPTVINDMEPAEFGRLFGDILKHLGTFTTPNQRPQDPMDGLQRLLNALPPTARRALITLISTDGADATSLDDSEDAVLARLSGGPEPHSRDGAAGFAPGGGAASPSAAAAESSSEDEAA